MGSIDKACISGFLCRLCSEMHRIVIHIYGDQGQRLCLVEKINGYLPITISPTDPLPKTICTTCLRRVEQHYDLLMRLSRIKEERFLRISKEQRRRIEQLPHVSSIENSDDEVYHSDEDSRRRRHQDQLPQLTQQTASSAEPSPSSAVLAISTNSTSLNAIHADSDDDEDGGSTASTSSSSLTALTQNLITIVDTAATTVPSSSSSTNHSRSMEVGSSFVDDVVVGGNSFGVALQHNHD